MSRAKGVPQSPTQPKACPVAALAHEAARVYKALAPLQERLAKAKEGARPDRLAETADALHTRLFGIEDQASHLVATSAEGVLFQCFLLFSFADAFGKGRSERASKRMLFSLRAYIEAETGAALDETLGAYYMRRDLNPHFLITEALADAAYEQEARS